MRQKSLILFCVLALLLGVGPMAHGEEGESDLVLVGLAYESDALDGANLANGEGTGFRLGYLDGERIFWQIAYTEVGTLITATR